MISSPKIAGGRHHNLSISLDLKGYVVFRVDTAILVPLCGRFVCAMIGKFICQKSYPSAHQTGQAFIFTARTDGAIVHEIEKLLGARIERRRLSGFDFGDLASAGRSGEGGALQRNRRRFRPSIAGRRRRARS